MPVAWVEFRGPEVLASSNTDPIAYYQSGHWIHGGRRNFCIEFRGLLTLQFESPSQSMCSTFSSYYGLRLRGRYLFAGRAKVATLWPKTGHWLRYDTAESWLAVRVAAGGPPPAMRN